MFKCRSSLMSLFLRHFNFTECKSREYLCRVRLDNSLEEKEKSQ